MTLYCHCASINAVCHDRGGHCHRNRPGRVSPRRSITHRRYIASAISGEPHHRSSCDPEFRWSRLAQDSSWTWTLRSTAPDRSGTHKANRFRRGYEYGRAKGNCPCGQSGCRCCLRTRSRTPPIGERTKVMQIKRCGSPMACQFLLMRRIFPCPRESRSCATICGCIRFSLFWQKNTESLWSKQTMSWRR